MDRSLTVTGFNGSQGEVHDDCLAVEEPLEIRLVHGPLAKRMRQSLTVTLRTPGYDSDLACGLLFSEGLITDRGDILSMTSEANVIRVELAPHVVLDKTRAGRTFASTASCGLCGKTLIASIEADCESIQSSLVVPMAVIHRLPAPLREAQPSFDRTGGLHAAALFDAIGTLRNVREDVGRHNAVDKVLGAELQAGRTILNDRILLVSGRAGFELVQKAARFGVPVMAAVGAPTTLAVELAQRLGLTLLGFVRDGRANCYSHPHRLVAVTMA